RHGHVGAGAVAVVDAVVDLRGGGDVGAFLQVGVEVHPQVRRLLVVDVAARLQLRTGRLADAVAGGSRVALPFDRQRRVEGEAAVLAEVGGRIALAADARAGGTGRQQQREQGRQAPGESWTADQADHGALLYLRDGGSGADHPRRRVNMADGRARKPDAWVTG